MILRFFNFDSVVVLVNTMSYVLYIVCRVLCDETMLYYKLIVLEILSNLGSDLSPFRPLFTGQSSHSITPDLAITALFNVGQLPKSSHTHHS